MHPACKPMHIPHAALQTCAPSLHGLLLQPHSTRALLTMALLTMTLLTMLPAVLTMALLTMALAPPRNAKVSLDGRGKISSVCYAEALFVTQLQTVIELRPLTSPDRPHGPKRCTRTSTVKYTQPEHTNSTKEAKKVRNRAHLGPSPIR